MSLFDLIIVAVALAMDCFTVSLVSGVILRKRIWGVILSMGLLFGLFQGLMPFIGWLLTNRFATYIEAYDHWVAFLLLAFIGVKMIRDAFSEEEETAFDPASPRAQLLLAVATSIDALAVGISFACMGYRDVASMTVPVLVIGGTSLILSVAGNLLGIRFGRSIARRLRPELLGGVILILIGLKILITHLME